MVGGLHKCQICGAYTDEPTHCGKPAVLLLDGSTRLRVSKTLSLALRHSPAVLGLVLDSRGWGEVEAVLRGLDRAGLKISREALEAVVALDDKGRFEMSNGKIRARYGHSIDVEVEYEVDEDSASLYHGTSKDNLPFIMAVGILPMKRKFVHLATDVDTACLNAARRPSPIVIEVDAECLRRSGVVIYIGSRKIRLAKYVPQSCIKRVFQCL
ncbi:MAG: RNA 2'-phosphotransferase [Pyrobaculum arsenaticum]|uniref:Probable RNA 2'-phosphotransferase n=2 Tax=Pyrobaculum arsenaticum TaxID=121277 RepID=A4WJQ8_PYRAR|nr:RNA 2'-phosphotransferase [Pyrobaculum arsenaticum]ABP50625.1 phosphotransferase KptA/Tpt1 [Pyrobaculum arsenaticum DSM 13514]MCY0889552.1 RNA 2'-phosphotransferase [Pyrobaculum arsenaticum]NYR14443.1 RNA 2'-phosphotransferase [Pyrobaculum arsenaticum]